MPLGRGHLEGVNGSAGFPAETRKSFPGFGDPSLELGVRLIPKPEEATVCERSRIGLVGGLVGTAQRQGAERKEVNAAPVEAVAQVTDPFRAGTRVG